MGSNFFRRVDKEDDKSPDKFLFISKPISIPEMTRQIKQFIG